MSSFPHIDHLPNVIRNMFDRDYWLARVPDPHAILFDGDDIARFNARVYSTLGIPPVWEFPDQVSGTDVHEQIAAYHEVARPTRYDHAGQALTLVVIEQLIANASPQLPALIPVRFGLATRRTHVRSLPTMRMIAKKPFEHAFDRLQETTIDSGWPVAVLADSRDRQWHFCLTPHYWGWVARDHIALGSRRAVADYVQAEPFLVTVANRGLVALKEYGITPQMGTRLPLQQEHPDHYVVLVPTATPDGQLDVMPGYIAKTAGQFNVGYRPLTLSTLFNAAFSLLGEPYAWGGSRLGLFGRDCSRYVKDVYGVTGLILPRNGDEQCQVGTLRVSFSDSMSDAERKAAIMSQAKPGDLLITPGHVMLYLGRVENEPFVIHDTATHDLGVTVSDLSLGAFSENGSLLRRLTHLVGV